MTRETGATTRDVYVFQLSHAGTASRHVTAPCVQHGGPAATDAYKTCEVLAMIRWHANQGESLSFVATTLREATLCGCHVLARVFMEQVEA